MKQVACQKQVVVFGELMMRLLTKRYEKIVQAREFDVSYSGAEVNLAAALAAYGVGCWVVSSARQSGRRRLPGLSAPVRRTPRPRQAERFSAGDLLRRDGCSPAAFHLPLQPAGQLDYGAAARRVRLGGDLRGEALVPRDGHHAGLGRQRGPDHPRGRRGGQNEGAHRKLRPELPPQAVVGRKGPPRHVRADGVHRRLVHERGGSGDRVWDRGPGGRRGKEVRHLSRGEGRGERGEGRTLRGESSSSSLIPHPSSLARYEDVAAQLVEKFGLKYVGITLRESLSATANDWSGMLYDGRNCYTSRKYHLDFIVDRIGGGDAFSAGIVYGLLTGQDLQETTEFAAAASCLKHTIHGDVNLASFDEVLAILGGDGTGRIQR